uniref:Putative LOC100639574 [Amphimedon queenslandica] n=1 Tax=Lepeophtheirus salmonis TaxID=72036 RepID=A0A0K2VI68_LEPSM
MQAVVINILPFKPHSTRAAMVAFKRNEDSSLAEIVKQGFWPEDSIAFQRFYNVPLFS